ncbi:hypothetical protein HYALB_00005184 [Hymenoscyphus albidus]|uniref:Uncharacterized protein n=1 Tax=Hymenoscyphus albidus TaxID=595503 RepID=A0A9N9QAD7_9HELO|nr:hypothetical protein HYALB_00005184 [Hymenoscyphus albidus]
MALIIVSSPVAEWREMRTFWYRRYLPALFNPSSKDALSPVYIPQSTLLLFVWSWNSSSAHLSISRFGILVWRFPKRSSDARGVRFLEHDSYAYPSVSNSISNKPQIPPSQNTHPVVTLKILILVGSHGRFYGKLDIDKLGRALSIARASFIGCCYLGALRSGPRKRALGTCCGPAPEVASFKSQSVSIYAACGGLGIKASWKSHQPTLCPKRGNYPVPVCKFQHRETQILEQENTEASMQQDGCIVWFVAWRQRTVHKTGRRVW